MKVVLLTGLSGAGKSVAIRALEDADFFCVDNLPPAFIAAVVQRLNSQSIHNIAIAVDARTGKDIIELPDIQADLQRKLMDVRVIFLEASDETLGTRYSETRRRHPLSVQLGKLLEPKTTTPNTDAATVLECVQAERVALQPLQNLGVRLDTTHMTPQQLRRAVLDLVEAPAARLTLVLETFAFKTGLPQQADLVFDVRCLKNPHYDPVLRTLTGQDAPVAEALQNDPRSAKLLHDIEAFLRHWIPEYIEEQRNYVTVAIGCTGGQHRSVYVAQALAERLIANAIAEVRTVLVRHRNPGV